MSAPDTTHARDHTVTGTLESSSDAPGGRVYVRTDWSAEYVGTRASSGSGAPSTATRSGARSWRSATGRTRCP